MGTRTSYSCSKSKKKANNAILVEDRIDTINSLGVLLKTRTQWTDYMDKVLYLISINRDNNHDSTPIFDHTLYPYCMEDISVLEYDTGFVYLIASVKQ